MIKLSLAGLLGGMFLDLVIGDPPRFPHPVRLFGWCIDRVDAVRRKLPGHDRLLGVLMALTLPALVFAGTWGGLAAARDLHPGLGWVLSATLLWTTVSFRDLLREAGGVLGELEAKNRDGARRRLARIVGRDTRRLDESGIARATVETVAEGYLDGILSPLFWALLAGVPGAMAYKALNTMDSMVGYRTDEYRRFGAAAARLDDAVNWIPARLSVGLIGAAASVSSAATTAFRVGWRDRRNHPSPNAAHPEASFAGALGCRLGGVSEYGGVRVEKPLLHPEAPPPDPRHVRGSMRLLKTTHLITAVAACLLVYLGFDPGGLFLS